MNELFTMELFRTSKQASKEISEAKDMSMRRETDGIRSPKTPPFIYGTLRAPRQTEKAMKLQHERNQYVFEIDPRATKGAVKDALERFYGVTVQAVRIVHIPPKRRRLGRFEGERKQMKKAIVTLSPGQKIDIGTSV